MHPQIFDYLKKESVKRLRYNEDKFQSYKLLNEGLDEALLHDLLTTVFPYIDNTSIETLNTVMMKIREKDWK